MGATLEAILEEFRFWIPVVVSIGALLVAVLGWLSSRRSADAAVVSASASKKSADQAERSADVAVSSYKLQLQPYVIALAATKRVPVPHTSQFRDVNAVYLENRGTGVACEITAKLSIGPADGGPEKPSDYEVAVLRPGDRQEIGPVQATDRLEVWGRVSFYNAEREPTVLECSRGEKTWREVKE